MVNHITDGPLFFYEGSHFGKINCLHTKMNEKIVGRRISFKKDGCTTVVKLESFSFLICLMPLFAVFGKVCGLDVSQCM